jgi:NADH:ubiquinone oxidoreductase subunit F (NADH-binding)
MAIWAPTCWLSGKAFHLEVRMGAGAYICGEETALLESLEGKRGVVRAKPPLPALEGLFGKPTVINNVISLATVPIILARGAAFYKNYGVGRSRGTLPFQLAGNVKYGGLVEKAFGLTLRELLDDFGGGTLSGRPMRAVQVGGPLGAYMPQRSSTRRSTMKPSPPSARWLATAAWWCSTTASTWRSRRAMRWNSAPSNPAANARHAASVPHAASR